MADASTIRTTLAAALGVDLVELDIQFDALMAAGIIEPGKNGKGPVMGPKQIASLLFAAMAGTHPDDTARMVGIIGGLGFGRLCRDVHSEGQVVTERLASECDLVREGGTTLIEQMCNFMGGWNEHQIEPANLVIGGAQGTYWANIVVIGTDYTGPRVIGWFQYFLDPTDMGRWPDDVSRARLERSATVGGEIFAILRDLAGDTLEISDRRTDSRVVSMGTVRTRHKSLNLALLPEQQTGDIK